ncbi:hypothetical protein F5J12DRAFT_779708 [Pisolithus orientalis]|uniref:uncharacterized protein n=1 Tax=Pisolithus orientalis TaxID=936130 RepID=UPI0022244771|nr:uncharacterized protein F5J12DRAFT_779708 [Pisolithus orientalis]KAI6030600.1 hypothetical protein F5J12DRAFT_779708 [Pisolithus orientalis]
MAWFWRSWTTDGVLVVDRATPCVVDSTLPVSIKLNLTLLCHEHKTASVDTWNCVQGRVAQRGSLLTQKGAQGHKALRAPARERREALEGGVLAYHPREDDYADSLQQALEPHVGSDDNVSTLPIQYNPSVSNMNGYQARMYLRKESRKGSEGSVARETRGGRRTSDAMSPEEKFRATSPSPSHPPVMNGHCSRMVLQVDLGHIGAWGRTGSPRYLAALTNIHPLNGLRAKNMTRSATLLPISPRGDPPHLTLR